MNSKLVRTCAEYMSLIVSAAARVGKARADAVGDGQPRRLAEGRAFSERRPGPKKSSRTVVLSVLVASFTSCFLGS